MKTLPMVFLPLLLSSCVTPPVESTPRTVSFEKRSWGNLLHRWTIDAVGRVEHVRDETPFGRDQAHGYQRRSLVLSSEQRRDVDAALNRIRDQRGKPERQCELRMTDGPYGKLAWTRGTELTSFDWNANCVKGGDADVTAAIAALDKIVDDAALATPVLQMLPEEGGGKGR